LLVLTDAAGAPEFHLLRRIPQIFSQSGVARALASNLLKLAQPSAALILRTLHRHDAGR
jgi:hypothetical protein